MHCKSEIRKKNTSVLHYINKWHSTGNWWHVQQGQNQFYLNCTHSRCHQPMLSGQQWTHYKALQNTIRYLFVPFLSNTTHPANWRHSQAILTWTVIKLDPVYINSTDSSNHILLWPSDIRRNCQKNFWKIYAVVSH